MILLDVPFSEKDAAKSLGARWNPSEKKWYIPENLQEDTSAFQKWLPGLDTSDNSISDEQGLPQANTQQNGKQVGIPLSSLMNQVQQAIRGGIPGAVWVVAEVANLNERRGHLYLELAETQDSGQQLANCRAMIWQSTAGRLLEKFTSQTGSEMAIGQKLLLLVEPTFHEKFGFSLVIQDIDPSFTLGELEAKVQAIRQQLIDEKLYDLNKQYSLPNDFFRLAVIAPPEAAGLGDFRADADLLSDAGLCEFKYFYSAFQGDKVEFEMSAAIAAFQAIHASIPFDALIIIRGGGAKLDLQPLNNYILAKALAEVKIPVMTGIGHERDLTLLDEISAAKFDTPSKVIWAVANAIFSAGQNAQGHWHYIVQASQLHIQKQKQIVGDFNTSIVENSQKSIQKEQLLLGPIFTKIEHLSQRIVQEHKSHLKQLNETVQLQTQSQLNIKKEQLNQLYKVVCEQPSRILTVAKSQLKQSIGFVLSSGPKTQLNRGFAMITNSKNLPITSVKDFAKQDQVSIKFKDGSINASPIQNTTTLISNDRNENE